MYRPTEKELLTKIESLETELRETKTRSMKRWHHNTRLTNGLRAIHQYTKLAGPEHVSEEAGKLIRNIVGSTM